MAKLATAAFAVCMLLGKAQKMFSHANYDYMLTPNQVSQTADLDKSCKTEYGSNAHIAEWNHLTIMSSNILNQFCDTLGIPVTQGKNHYFVTYNGNRFHTAGRQYFFERQNGQVPQGWGDHALKGPITLGSWYVPGFVVCCRQSYSCCSGGGTDCATCVAQGQRTSNCHCQTCNSGYYNPGTSGCQAYSCCAGGGTDCATCVSQDQRTSNCHCQACNSGYYSPGTSGCQAPWPVQATTATTTATQVTAVGLNTAIVASAASMLIYGSLVINVSNVSQFVLEPNVERAMQMAIANLSSVNISWVVGVTVTLVSSRRLSVDSPGIEDDTNERQLSGFSINLGSVQVNFQISFPAGGGATVIVEQTVDTLNTLALNEASEVIDKILKSGVLGQPYDATVIKLVSLRAPPAPEPAPSPPKANSGNIGMLIVVISCGITLPLICVSMALCAMRKQLLLRPHKVDQDMTPDNSAKAVLLNVQATGSWNSYTVDTLLFPPDQISSAEGERIRNLVRAMIDYQHHQAHVFLTYAVGRRSRDDPDVGPGMYYAAAVTKALYDKGIECYSDLALPAGTDPDVIHGAISIDKAIKVLIVLQTKALYECPRALKQIYTAQKKDVITLPLRFGSDLPSKEDEWPHVHKDDLDSVLMLMEVQSRFGSLNCMPSPPYTVMEHKQVLDYVVSDVHSHIAKQASDAAPLENPAFVSEHTSFSSHPSQVSKIRLSAKVTEACIPSSSSMPSASSAMRTSDVGEAAPGTLGGQPSRADNGHGWPNSVDGQPSRANDELSTSGSKGTSSCRSVSEPKPSTAPPSTVIGQPLEDRPTKTENRTDEAGNVRMSPNTKECTAASTGRMLALQPTAAQNHLNVSRVATTGKGFASDIVQKKSPRPLTNEPGKSPRSLTEFHVATTGKCFASNIEQKKSPRLLANEPGNSPRPITESATCKNKSSSHGEETRNNYDQSTFTPKQSHASRKKNANNRDGQQAAISNKQAKDANRPRQPRSTPRAANDSPNTMLSSNETPTCKRKANTRKKDNASSAV